MVAEHTTYSHLLLVRVKMEALVYHLQHHHHHQQQQQQQQQLQEQRQAWGWKGEGVMPGLLKLAICQHLSQRARGSRWCSQTALLKHKRCVGLRVGVCTDAGVVAVAGY
jgi:hypothetical protein